jgi:hypothetical protein
MPAIAAVERSVRIVNFITGEAWEFVVRMPLAATLGYTQGVSLVRRNVGVFPEYEVILGNICGRQTGFIRFRSAHAIEAVTKLNDRRHERGENFTTRF